MKAEERKVLIGEMKEALIPELKDALIPELKDALIPELKDALIPELKDALIPELKNALIPEMKDALIPELKNALIPEMKVIFATKEELRESEERSKRHMGVLYENMQHKLDLVIEMLSPFSPRITSHEKRIEKLEGDVSFLMVNAARKA